jgi:methyl-accepting chemotaxis protein
MKLTFRQKLFLPLLISWLCLAALTAVNVFQNKQRRFEERQLALKYATDVGMSMLKAYADAVDRGVLSADEGKAQALTRLKAMRYGKDGYFTIVDSHPTVVMHPIKLELAGKDVSDFKDPNGQFIYRNVAAIAKGAGEGWIEYVWPKPGHPDQKQVFPKGAYVLTFKPWDWTFITGLYLDDLTGAFMADLWRAAWLLSIIGVVLTGIVVLVIRSIERTVGGDPDDVTEITRRIAAGDLSGPIVTRHGDRSSLLHGIRTMRDNLSAIVSQVRQGSDSMATGSEQIASGNADLSQRTEQQAANLQQTAASMEQLNATVKRNADAAQHAVLLAGQASEAAEHGGQAVGQVVATMDAISASSRRIGDIISVVDGIAFQTNILALNAAVEAARAGEHGRGFAVVAGEVRTLAQRSADAAREIKALVNTSLEKVDTGSQLVVDAGASIDRLVSQVQRVAALITDISTAVAEQTTGISQVSDAMTQLDQVTQQNAALVEESAAAAASLQQQARRMVEVVTVFKLANANAQEASLSPTRG